MRDRIKPNDVVLHKPSGEKWVVAGVNQEAGYLIPCGWPFPSFARIDSCELAERNYEQEPQRKEVILQLLHKGLDGYVDARSAAFHGVGTETPAPQDVVRCKDCRHVKRLDGYMRCPFSTMDLKEDGYCAHGERGRIE